MDWLDLLAVRVTLKSLLQQHSLKASVVLLSATFMVQLLGFGDNRPHRLPSCASAITLGPCHTFPWFKKKKSAFLTVPFNRLSSEISYRDYSKFSADEIFFFWMWTSFNVVTQFMNATLVLLFMFWFLAMRQVGS